MNEKSTQLLINTNGSNDVFCSRVQRKHSVNLYSSCASDNSNSYSVNDFSLNSDSTGELYGDRLCGNTHPQPHHGNQHTQRLVSSSISSSSQSPPSSTVTSSVTTGASTHNGSGYSELLRYRSQEFYTKLVYSTTPSATNGSTTTTTSSTPTHTPTTSSSKESQAEYSLHNHVTRYSHHHPLPSSLTTKELSLNDLSQPSLYASLDPSGHEVTSQHQLSPQQLLQSRLASNRYIPHHPHYNNHLYSAGAVPGSISGSASLVRSNSSLSLSYHQQLQYQKKYSRLLNHHNQNHNQFLVNHSNLATQNNPTVTLSTHNLFTDSGYCSAYSGSIGSGTLDSRISKVSSDSSYYQPLSVASQNGTHHLENGHNGQAYTKSVETSPVSSTTSNYYSSSPSLSTSSSQSPQKLSLMVSSSSPSHGSCTTSTSSVTNQAQRPYGTVSTVSGGRATLIRSSSSGTGVAESVLSVASNSSARQYNQSVHNTYLNGSSRPASLVTVTDQKSVSGSMHPNQHSQYASTGQQQYSHYGTNSNTQSGYHLYGTTTSKNVPSQVPPNNSNNPQPYHKTNGALPNTSSSNYGLPQRFPTTISQTKSPSVVKLVNSVGSSGQPPAQQPPPTIMSSSYHQHYSAGQQQAGKVVTGSVTGSSVATGTSASSSSNNPNSNISLISNQQQQSSFPRSLFTNTTNIFESKKNKLFGSVSSIDLQCLKESQKVSVIERKSSRVGRSLKNTSASSATAIVSSVSSSVSSTNPTNSSNGSGSVVGGSGGGSVTGGGSTSSATSSFFRLFTSSSSKKMIPFAFSSNSSTSQSGPLSPPSTIPSATCPSGSSSSASSSSSTQTITARSDTISGDSKRVNGIDQSKPIKSNSLDSASSASNTNTMNSLSLSTANMSIASSTATSTEPMIPSNEVLFRKFFTFYDLMASTNLNRLFDIAATSGTTSSINSSTSSMSTSSLSVSSTSGATSMETNSTTSNTYQHRVLNGVQSGPVTTFESSTLSSTSSYSSCTSSMSSASHPTVPPIAPSSSSQQYPQHYSKSCSATMSTSVTSTTSNHINSNCQDGVGNDLLASSLNFLNEIGSERQYSIELRWNNGCKEEIPAEMLNEQKHNQDQSIYDTVSVNGAGATSQANSNLDSSKPSSPSIATSSSTAQLHPPSFAKRINIFSDGSPFAALSAHSVMCDLYGSGSLTVGTGSSASKSIVADFNDLDDGFGSLSSTSLGSTYPNGSSGTIVSGANSGATTISRCPFSTASETCNLLEMDHGTNYYRTHFRDFEHQNWLQIHEKYGPIVVSLRKERVKCSSGSSSGSGSNAPTTRWRVIVRTTSLIPLRGTIASLPSICQPGGSPGSCSLDSGSVSSSRSRGSTSSNGESFNINSVKDVVQLVMPKNVCVSSFRLASPTAVSCLLKLDELSQNTEYKIGVLYAYGAQHSEEEFYNNILDYSSSSKNQFYDFLGLIASRVRLKDFKGYKAGLDVQNDTTGEHSWTSRFAHVDIMFHVCTELPFTETNRQQLPRKRHIGNDIVTIVFLNEDFHGSPFSPSLIRSKFQQVFIIIKPVNNGQYYRVAVARHKLVPLFGPPLKQYYTRHELRDFILTKIINAENACHSVNKFAEMAKRTRNEYLVDLCNKHATNQTVHHVDSSSTSNSLNSFKKLFGSSSTTSGSSGCGTSSGDHHHAKRTKHLSANHEFHHLNQDSYLTGGSLLSGGVPPYSRSHILNGIKDPPTLLGGIMFNERCAGSTVPSRLYVHDFSTSRDIEASLLLSNEAILVIDAFSSEVIWAVPVTSIIGWTDSSGVFATSPTTTATSPVSNTIDKFQQQINGSAHRFGPMRAKSMDCEPMASTASCRELRLYYHQGECIQIMQRPTGAPSLPALPEPSPSTISKSGRSHSIPTTTRNDDPFLHLVRILELITRKSELREIVIKRKTSPVHKPQSNLPFDLLGRCGGQFGFSLSLSTGIIEDIMDQTLSAYHLSPGCKVVEIAKISFAAMAPEELQELLSASVIICLTFTEFDFARYQPKCNCPWPQALQLLQRQKNQMTPPSEYENLPLAPKMPPLVGSQSATNSPAKLANGSSSTNQNGPPGVKSIHITHNTNSSLPQPSDHFPTAHQALMNVSSTSSTSSYYSTTNNSSQNQSPSHSYHQPYSINQHPVGSTQSQLYQAKSASNLSQYSHQYGPANSHHQSSPTKSATSSAISSTNSPANNGANGTVVRSKSSTINSGNGNTSFKDNLIRLITMDDCAMSPTNSSHSPNTSSGTSNGEVVDVNSVEVKDYQVNNLNSTQLSLVSNYHPNSNYYTTTTSVTPNRTVGHGQSTMNQPFFQQRTPNHQPYSQVDIVDPYSSYPSSRYSTASSTQYSSLGRNAAINSTQIQLNNSSSGPIISGQMGRINPNSVIPVVENNDCYLLTAQPVRVDSNSSSSSATLATSGSSRELHTSHLGQLNNLMTASLDSASLMSSSISSNTCNSSSSAAMFNSLMSSSTATSASETIADIVWPSMHQPSTTAPLMMDSPPSSLMIHTPLNVSTLANNEIVVTGTEQQQQQHQPAQVTNPPVVAAQLLTEEVRKLSLEKVVMNDTIIKLQEENKRLHQESQNASHQLRKLTEWFFNTGSSGGSNNSGCSSSSSSSNAATPTTSTNSTTTISIQQQAPSPARPGSNNHNHAQL